MSPLQDGHDDSVASVRQSGLTNGERRVLETLGEAYNQFAGLEREHPSEMNDFCNAVHSAQRIVLARVGRRALSGPIRARTTTTWLVNYPPPPWTRLW